MKEILLSLFSGIIGIVLTIAYQHYFAQPQSFTFIYNGKEMLVTESTYAELVEENEMLKRELSSIKEDQNSHNNQANGELDIADIDIPTPTTTSGEKESPAIVKNTELILPRNPVKTNIEINLEIHSSTCPEEEIGNYSSDKEKKLLREAKELCERKNYDEAITIYVCDALKDNPYAKINLGYLYAHGYGYKEDVETALKIYDSVDMDIAKRNKLALLITANSEGIYDAEIVRLIYYFTEKNDYYVQNYVTNCIYNKNVELLTDEERNITCYLKDLYVLELINIISSNRTYNMNQAYKKLVYDGLSYKTSGTDILAISPYYSYHVYQYSYLNWLERIYA